MTHVLFYIGLSGMLVLAVFFIFLVRLRVKKKPEPEPEVFEIS